MKVIEHLFRTWLLQPPPKCACGRDCVRLAFIMGHRFTDKCWECLKR